MLGPKQASVFSRIALRWRSLFGRGASACLLIRLKAFIGCEVLGQGLGQVIFLEQKGAQAFCWLLLTCRLDFQASQHGRGGGPGPGCTSEGLRAPEGRRYPLSGLCRHHQWQCPGCLAASPCPSPGACFLPSPSVPSLSLVTMLRA